MNQLTHFLVTLPAFLLAIILHEVAHAWVAYKCGDDTARLSGRITLNPIPHLDPLGSLMFILSSFAGIGFGWAKPVPVNTLRLRNPRRDDILVSLAGVTANALQALAWAGIARLLLPHVAQGSSLAEAAIVFCAYAALINLVLMVFNLIPIPPLDGSHVLFQLLNLRDPLLYHKLMQVGPMLLLLLLYFHGLDPIFDRAVYPLAGLLLPGIL